MFKAGGVPWNKGKPATPEHRAKVSAGMKRHQRTPEHCRRIGEAKKGCAWTPEQRSRISATLKAKGIAPPRPPRACLRRGRDHRWWRGGVTTPNEAARKTPEYRAWRAAVFVRDDYTCVACGRRGGRLHADHEKPFALFPALRFEVSNGRTMCVECHRQTPTYGVNTNRDLWGNQAPESV